MSNSLDMVLYCRYMFNGTAFPRLGRAFFFNKQKNLEIWITPKIEKLKLL
ncbi:hypothetical protein SAMN05660816_04472 [Niastella yeongjuensis]|nr:hypothetical protein SAMN05660816_04472 [Niastella yeongjuensis]